MPANAPKNAHPSETDSEKDRSTYLKTVIEHYVTAFDTFDKARRSDWAIAATFYQRGVPLTVVIHAIRLCVLRRNKRDPALRPLEPIASLAYFRPLIRYLLRAPHESDYIEAIFWSYHDYFAEKAETSASQPESRSS